MEEHARQIDATDLSGHSGLPPRALGQTLLETRMLGSEIAGAGIEAVDRFAHPPAPTGQPLEAAAVDTRAAQAAASSGVASAGGPRPDSSPSAATPPGGRVDPRAAYRTNSPETGTGARAT